jgi:hypothetical protein
MLAQELAKLQETVRQLTLAQSFSRPLAGAGAGAGAGTGGAGGAGVSLVSPAQTTPSQSGSVASGRRHRSASINATTAVPFVLSDKGKAKVEVQLADEGRG